MSREGIDIRQAWQILAERSTLESGQGHSMEEEGESGNDRSCPCCRGATVEDVMRGQRIDLVPKSVLEKAHTDKTTSPSPSDHSSALDQPQHAGTTNASTEVVQEASRARRNKIDEELKGMTKRELLNSVLETQQQRVITYREFDRGLDQILDSAIMVDYPPLCAEVTASFSVLSDMMTALRDRLAQDEKPQHRKQPSMEGLSRLVANLQSQEKEKLSLTAALHLERIRERLAADDARTQSLLRAGIISLQQRTAACVEQINETLEEIRCALLDLE